MYNRRLYYLWSSASQVDQFRQCNRRWFARYALNLPDEKTEAQARGTRVHGSGEAYLKGKEVKPLKDPAEQKMAETLISLLPEPDPRFLVEYEFVLKTYDGGPDIIGYIDFVDPDRVNEEGLDEPLVQDQKSRSDLRYAKKEQELLKDPQMVIYAKWVFRVGTHVESVLLRHQYLQTKTKGRGKDKFYPHKVVEVVATRADVEPEWQRVLKDISTMQAWYESGVTNIKKLPGNAASCHSFGRECPYLYLCGFGINKDKLNKFGEPKAVKALPVKRLPVINNAQEEEDMGTLQDRLNNKNGAAGKPAAAPPAAKKPAAAPAAPAAKPGTLAARKPAGLNPPDAPPNKKGAGKPPVEDEQPEGEEQEAADDTPPPAKKGTLAARSRAASSLTEQMAEEEQAAEEEQVEEEQAAEEEQPEEEAPPPAPARRPAAQTAAPRPAPKPTAPKPAPKPAPAPAPDPEPDNGMGTSPSFTLYIGCMPAKGEKFMLLHDFFKPVAEQIEEENGLADYRLIDFGKWKGPAASYLKQLITEHHDGTAIVIQHLGQTADLCVEVLSVYASKIVTRC